MRRRVRKEYAWQSGAWVQTNEVHYVYDRNVVIQERDTNNVPQVTYTRGNDLSGGFQGAGGIGGLLARTDTNSSAFYHADGNGNITMMVDTNQAIVAKYEYDPYGNILAQSGTLADANLYRFSSKEFHASSGMIYYLYRFYDENLQRWPSRDPIGENGGLNLYTYVSGDPINNTDEYGLFVLSLYFLYTDFNKAIHRCGGATAGDLGWISLDLLSLGLDFFTAGGGGEALEVGTSALRLTRASVTAIAYIEGANTVAHGAGAIIMNMAQGGGGSSGGSCPTGGKGPIPDKKIIDQLAGKGQLRDLLSNPNIKGVDMNYLIQKTPIELEQMVKSGQLDKRTFKQIMNPFEGRNLRK